MRFFELTNIDGKTVNIPVDSLLRIATFYDEENGKGVVQFFFRDGNQAKPFLVTINTKRETETNVVLHIQNDISTQADDPIVIKPNMPNVTGIYFR